MCGCTCVEGMCELALCLVLVYSQWHGWDEPVIMCTLVVTTFYCPLSNKCWSLFHWPHTHSLVSLTVHSSFSHLYYCPVIKVINGLSFKSPWRAAVTGFTGFPTRINVSSLCGVLKETLRDYRHMFSSYAQSRVAEPKDRHKSLGYSGICPLVLWCLSVRRGF